MFRQSRQGQLYILDGRSIQVNLSVRSHITQHTSYVRADAVAVSPTRRSPLKMQARLDRKKTVEHLLLENRSLEWEQLGGSIGSGSFEA